LSDDEFSELSSSIEEKNSIGAEKLNKTDIVFEDGDVLVINKNA
jgi:23S rRNA-/tRNA-specific pseudouridylate synthase